MSLYKSSKITNLGQDLLLKCLAGEAEMQFTRIAFGAGEYSSDNGITAQAALKDEKQTVSISTIAIKSSNTVICSAILSNADLETGYRITEVGLFAKNALDTNSKEIMYAVCIAEEGFADYFPAYNGYAPVKILQDFYIEVADSSSTTILVDDNVAVTKKYFNEKISELSNSKEDKAIVGNINFSIGGQGATGNHTVNCEYTKVGNQVTIAIPAINYARLPSSCFFALNGFTDELMPKDSFCTLMSFSNNNTYQDLLKYSAETDNLVVYRTTGSGDSDYYYNNQINGGFAGGMFTYLTTT